MRPRLHGSSRFATATLGAVILTCMPTAWAGTVAGSLELPEPSRRPSPPERSRGYVVRVPHPLMPAKPTEQPFRDIFIVLTGGIPDEAGTKPDRRPVELDLVGQRFESNVYPALVGQTILLRNLSTEASNRGVTPRIDAPGHREVFVNASDAGNPLNPRGERELKLAEPFSPIELRDLDSPHLRTLLVGVPHRYFAVPDDRGNFNIDDVPAGTWTVKVWYRNGWLAGATAEVDVPARGAKKISINVPPAMTVEPAGGSK